MTDVYLCRHGETELNDSGRLRGRLDVELDAVGTDQAHDLAQGLSGIGIARVISSPLRRALQTATALAEQAQVSVELDNRLADRDYGRLAGVPEADVIAEFGSLEAAPGVETVEEVLARALAVLDDLVAEPQSGPVALVSHDAVIKQLLHHLFLRTTKHVNPSTGSWTLLRHDDEGWHLLRVNGSK